MRLKKYTKSELCKAAAMLREANMAVMIRRSESALMQDAPLPAAAAQSTGSTFASIDAKVPEKFLKISARSLHKHIRAKSAAVLVAVLVLFFSMAVAVNAQARRLALDLVRRFFGAEDRVSYVFMSDEMAARDSVLPELDFELPDGFELRKRVKESDCFYSYFENKENGESIVISYAFGDSDTIITVERETEQRRSVRIGGYDADYYPSKEASQANLIWTDPDKEIVIVIGSTLPEEMIFKIAESI